MLRVRLKTSIFELDETLKGQKLLFGKSVDNFVQKIAHEGDLGWAMESPNFAGIYYLLFEEEMPSEDEMVVNGTIIDNPNEVFSILYSQLTIGG